MKIFVSTITVLALTLLWGEAEREGERESCCCCFCCLSSGYTRGPPPFPLGEGREAREGMGKRGGMPSERAEGSGGLVEVDLRLVLVVVELLSKLD